MSSQEISIIIVGIILWAGIIIGGVYAIYRLPNKNINLCFIWLFVLVGMLIGEAEAGWYILLVLIGAAVGCYRFYNQCANQTLRKYVIPSYVLFCLLMGYVLELLH